MPVSVSILVFLEPPLILFPEVMGKEYIDEFQSLFFWNHHLYSGIVHTMVVQNIVSILVFLEPPLILRSREFSGRRDSSFNPCFSGTTTYTFRASINPRCF